MTIRTESASSGTNDSPRFCSFLEILTYLSSLLELMVLVCTTGEHTANLKVSTGRLIDAMYIPSARCKAYDALPTFVFSKLSQVFSRVAVDVA